MTWVLFVWVYLVPGHPTAVASQEFNSHVACVNAERALESNFGQTGGFLCLEKGRPSDDKPVKAAKRKK